MAAFIGVTLLVLLVQDVPLSFYLRGVENDRIITALERDAFVLGGRSEEALESADPADDATLTDLARTYRDSGGARVVIVDAQGEAVVTSDDDQSRVGVSYASRPEIIEALTGTITSGTRYSDTLQQNLLYVTVPVFSGENVLGAVRLTYPSQVVTDAVNEQLRVLGLVALTTVLLAGIVGFIFSSSVTRRLHLLRQATERLAEGDLTARADESAGAPEIRALSSSFNRMAVRLNTLIQQQRTFAADASHQLRTPLTALRLRLERTQELLPTDPSGAAQRLAAAESEVDRLGNIVEGLLLLSHTEGQSAALITVDLAAIARERVEQWAPLAAESGVDIRFEGPATAPVQAITEAADQIIDNFIDNALTVSPAASTLVVRVSVDGSASSVHVLDEGPGLSPDDCSRAFDRFWRATSDSSGSGLGLAIVAQLAAASRADARLTPRVGPGLDASVTFVSAPAG